MRTATTMSLLMLTGILMQAGPAAAQAAPEAPAAPQLTPTWFNPRKPQPGQTYPLAVVLESAAFPAESHKFWVSTLFARNYCQCVVTSASDDWSRVSVNDVLKLIDPLPGNVPADGNRLLLVADDTTAPVAMRLLDGFPDRIAGVVFISARPLELTRAGQATVWLPRKDARNAPLWIVAGANPGQAAKTLNMWRTFRGLMPPDAPVTIDARLGRGPEPLLPDKAVVLWLDAIAAGNKPADGPDAQAEQVKATYAEVAATVDLLLQQQGFALPAGQKLAKVDGPMTVSFVAPHGWVRVPKMEQPYNPSGTVTSEGGLAMDSPANPFLQIGISPAPADPRQPSPHHGLILATEWDRSGADLVSYSNKRLTSKGYTPFPIKQWTSGDWTIELTALAYVRGEQWQSWLALSAARDGKRGDPAAPLIMLLSRAERPDAHTMVAVLNRLRQTVQVEWSGPMPAPTPAPIEE